MEPNLDQLFDICPEIICILKSNYTIHRVNPAFTQLFGWDFNRIQGRSFLDFVHAEWIQQTQQILQSTIDQTILAFETLHCKADGNQAYLTWSFSFDPSSQSIFGIARESEALKRFQDGILQENFRLTKLAYTDSLTELMNRRGFLTQLQQYQSFAARTQRPLSLLLLDVDYFKTFNDSYGHSAGDQALILIADLLKNNLRRSDLAGRYGGEEFVVCLLDSDQQGSLTVAESLRQAVDNYGWPIQDVTISIGVTTLIADQDSTYKTAKELIDEADRALYHSKQLGRNCSTHHANL